MRKPLVIHPFLFAIFPILSLFAHNFWEMSYMSSVTSEVLLPVACMLAVIGLMLLGLGKVLRNYKKAGVILSIFTLLFFTYGHIKVVFDGTVIGRHKVLFLLFFILFTILIIVVLKKKQPHYNALTKILNIVAIVLVILPLVNIAFQISKIEHNISSNIIARRSAIETVNSSSRKEEYRDIYYLIFDRYANNHSLKEFYDFDNSKFLNNLTNLGFYVAQESTSNYLNTPHSLSSSLNMEYINWLEDIMGKNSRNWSPLYANLLKNYKLLTFLKSKGYKILHFGSWWTPTATNKFADYNFIYSSRSRFHQLLIRNTAITPFLRLLYKKQTGFEGFDLLTTKHWHWQKVKEKFNKLEKRPSIDGPIFVFVHMNIPHPPHVFEKNGNFREIKHDLTEGERYWSKQ